MNHVEAQQRGLELLTKVGLTKKGWTLFVHYTKTARRFGACSPGRKQITICSGFVAVNPWSEVEITVLHEIAHALAFEAVGTCCHDEAWRQCCVMLGIKPSRKNYHALRPVRHGKRWACVANVETPVDVLKYAAENGTLYTYA